MALILLLYGKLSSISTHPNDYLMKKIKLFLFVLACSTLGYAQQDDYLVNYFHSDSTNYSSINTDDIIKERWDLLAQPNFWKEVMLLSEDSCIINVASTRQILGKDSFICWKEQTDEEKKAYKDSVRKMYDLPADTRIYVTSGKSNFYQLEKVLPSIDKAIPIFQKTGTDPWYAQAILLIESPGKIEYSNVGAYGPFQLMKSVARSHGLIVNSKIDERKDFEKSAQGAASLIQKTCIPEARRILTAQGITFDENDLWFKLFVLHIYHAGAGNVEGLLKSMDTIPEGQDLIVKMWQSEWGGFKNASQNYSQVALAALLNLREIIFNNCIDITLAN